MAICFPLLFFYGKIFASTRLNFFAELSLEKYREKSTERDRERQRDRERDRETERDRADRERQTEREKVPISLQQKEFFRAVLQHKIFENVSLK